jgi:polyhydroxyalkanoate synthesis regulator phasin
MPMIIVKNVHDPFPSTCRKARTVKERNMIDLIKKTMLSGVGLAMKTKDEIEDFAKEMEKKFNLSESDGKKFLDDLKNRYNETQEKLESKVEHLVKDMLKKMDIVTNEDLKGLKKEIRDLKKAISDSGDSSKS